MMSQKTWSSISVYDFFRTCNWTGEKIVLTTFNATDQSKNDQSLLRLNLQEFLLQSNWDGKQVKDFRSQSIKQSNQSLLSLSVKDFFKGIVWKSSPNIVPTSKPSSSKNSIDSSSTDLDLDNLSDLF
ncbi:hypothetical protein [Crocosphaera chwakensis]|uniref:Uncharacterized protein n=1 Tax=Crocosphaera chwakensis CCY0110 TaxID=391612 RepID=A3ISU4_9CHRO|nr:hypothetical protein [Crocosphaera chwakensis]EAZ90514.1 hypothetical protein CY0110_26842 [Crocosphaera chwakensis CCY0110]